MAQQIQKLPAVLERYPLSRSAFYRDMAEGLFPKPVSLGARAVGWPTHEVDAIISARIAGKEASEIRRIVIALEAARNVDGKGAAV